MKTEITRLLLAVLLCIFTIQTTECQTYEWRGPGRSGSYKETGLLNKWPDGGPKLIWEKNMLGDGYSSPAITDDAIYVTGRTDSSDVLTALSLKGEKKWEVVYGKAWMTNHTGSRCTPTVHNGKIYVISGSGDIVCVTTNGKIVWSKNHYNMFDSKPIMFGISESPVVTDNKVIVSPGGKKASLVAFNAENGEVEWQAEPLDEDPQYVNPLLIEYAGKKIIITVMAAHIFAVDAMNGKILWRVNYAEANGAAANVRKNHAITPLYRDGELIIANGYGWVAMKLKLNPDGTGVEKVWENRNFDPQLGGIVLADNMIIGANHQSDPRDTWVCVDWNSGKTLWTQKWYTRGSIISADNKLIMFEEKSGHVGLAVPEKDKLNIISEFQITKGEGPFWAHPVIKDGILYIRHGSYLLAYLVK